MADYPAGFTMDWSDLDFEDNNGPAVTVVDLGDFYHPQTTESVENYTWKENYTWNVFGETEDKFIFPALFFLLGLCGLALNLVIIVVILRSRRIQTGSNIMVLNLAICDVVFLLVCTPLTALNHAQKVTDDPLRATIICRVLHYFVFVTVYVSCYTMVVLCIFRFCGIFMPGKYIKLLSRKIAIVFNIIIWIIIMLSDINFLMEDDAAMFQDAFICLQVAPELDQTKVRTLWATFLTFAFLLPLLVICILSGAILRHVRRKLASEDRYEEDQFEMKSKREVTNLILAATVLRTLCWIPTQLLVMVNIFSVTDYSASHRKAEVFSVCLVYLSPCLCPLVYIVASSDLREAMAECLPCKCFRRDEDLSDTNETIMSIISDSTNNINYEC